MPKEGESSTEGEEEKNVSPQIEPRPKSSGIALVILNGFEGDEVDGKGGVKSVTESSKIGRESIMDPNSCSREKGIWSQEGYCSHPEICTEKTEEKLPPRKAPPSQSPKLVTSQISGEKKGKESVEDEGEEIEDHVRDSTLGSSSISEIVKSARCEAFSQSPSLWRS